MRRSSASIRVSSFWLAVYAICLVFVVSFILFEVLDVDGSDFPVSPANMAVKLTDPPHNDIKRAMLQGAPKVPLTGATSAADGLRAPTRGDNAIALHPLPVTRLRLAIRSAALPRSSLPDTPPSA